MYEYITLYVQSQPMSPVGGRVEGAQVDRFVEHRFARDSEGACVYTA
jgi:hypothetical protein